MLDGGVVGALRFGRDAVAGQHVELLLRGDQPGAIAFELRLLLVHQRVGLLGMLHGAGARPGQIGIANAVLLGKAQRRIRPGDIGLAVIDDGLLQHGLRIDVADRRVGGGDIGLGLIKRGAEITIVDPCQDLAALIA